MPSVILNIRLSPKQMEDLQVEAERRCIPVSTCAKMFVAAGLQDSERKEAERLLRTFEEDLDLRMKLRRLVLADPRPR